MPGVKKQGGIPAAPRALFFTRPRADRGANPAHRADRTGRVPNPC